jgi:hypothetical protein
MSKRLDLAFYLGATWEFDFVATDAAGAAIDLAGATVKWRLASRTALLLEADAEIVAAATGKCRVKVAPSRQAAIASGFHRHEAHVEQGDGDIYVAVVGSIWVKPSLFGLSSTTLSTTTNITLAGGGSLLLADASSHLQLAS